MGEEEVLLEDQPTGALFRWDQDPQARIVEHDIVEHDPSAGQRPDSGQSPQQGGLAGAVRTEDGHHLAVCHVELHVLVELIESYLDMGAQGQLRTAPSHLPRSATSTANEITRSSRDSATATRWFPSSAR